MFKKLVFLTLLLFSTHVYSWGGSSSSIQAAYSACASQLATFASDQYWGTAQGTICKNYPGGSNSGLIGFYNVANGGPAYGFDYPANTGCTSPATWSDTTHSCNSPLTCTGNTYNNGGTSCTPIPQCVTSLPNVGYYFDVNTKACVRTNDSLLICIGDKFTQWCPPTNDCKEATYICSNSPTIVATDSATASAPAAQKAASKAAADSTTSEIVNIQLQTQAEADAKVAAAASAKAAKDLANTQFQSAQTSGVQSAINDAIAAYTKFSQSYIDSLARANNATAATAAASATKAAAQAADNAIPAAVPGNAEALNKQVQTLLPTAIKQLQDSVNGTGNGNGNGTGSPTSSSPSTDTSGLAKESTQQGIKDDLDKLKGPKTVGGFAALADSYYTKKYPGGISQVWTDHQASINQTGFVSAVHSLTPNIATAGTCPSWDIPLGRLGTYTLTMPCVVWPFLRVVFILSSLFLARRLIFGG